MQAAAWYAARCSSSTVDDRPPSGAASVGGHRVAGHGEGDPAAQPDPARPRARAGARAGAARPGGAWGARTSSPSAPDRWTDDGVGHRATGRGHLGDGRVGRGDDERRRRQRRRRQVVAAGRARRRRRSPRRPAPQPTNVRPVPGRSVGQLSPDTFLRSSPSRGCRSRQAIGSVPGQFTQRPRTVSTSGILGPGVHQVGGQIGQRLDHEPPLPHAGVGDDQVRLVDHQVADQQHVDVEGPRADAPSRTRPAPASRRAASSSSSRGERRCPARPRD